MRPRAVAGVSIFAAIIIAIVAIVMHEYTASGSGSRAPQRLELLSDHPRIYRLPGLLSSDECDDLITLGESRLRLSEMGAAGEESDDGDGDNLASSRTSSSVFFDDPADAEQPLLQRLRARWSAAARLPLALAEPTQLTRYAGGESYGLHLDASDGVPRTATLLTYLSDDFDGGETSFPRVPATASADGAGGSSNHAGSPRGVMKPLAKLAAAGMLARELGKAEEYCSSSSRAVLRVAPRKGDGLLFFPLLPDGSIDHDAVHGGCQVAPRVGRAGMKWVVNQWFVLSHEVKSETDTEHAPRVGHF